MNRSRNIEEIEIIIPKTIKGFDTFSSFILEVSFEEISNLSLFLLRRFGKGLITINYYKNIYPRSINKSL